MREDHQYRQLIQKHNRKFGIIGDDSRDNTNDSHDADNNRTSPPTNWKLEEQRGRVRKAMHAVKQRMKTTGRDITSQLDNTMMEIMIANVDVAEFYSPPRITKMASQMGLRAGWSMDITTSDVDGKAWDFYVPEMRNRAARRILMDKPLLLIGSSMCTIHSIMRKGTMQECPGR